MEHSFPLANGLTLKIATRPDGRDGYATARLQKGFRLLDGDQDLVEEAVGFGIPLLKRGLQTIFPGSVELTARRTDSGWEVSTLYVLDLVERVARPGASSVRPGIIYGIKNYLAAAIRAVPPLRAPLTAASSGLRRLFGWQTRYEDAGFRTSLRLVHRIDPQGGSVRVRLDPGGLAALGVTEVIVMNELGAHFFDRYEDSSGLRLAGKQIGCWDAVAAGRAAFVSSARRIAFSLGQVEGARLFRGRELVGERLAWAGFGHSFPPDRPEFGYELRLERRP